MSRRRTLAASVGLTVIAVGLAGVLLTRQPGLQRVEVRRSLMSTWVRIVVYSDDPQRASRAIQAAFEQMSNLERELSRFQPESDVSRINRAPAGTPVAVGEGTWRVLGAAETAWQRTGGVFDVAVGPLISLWSQAAERDQLPTEEELAYARAHVGFDKVRLRPRGRQVVLTEPGMSIDLGGVAKGYIVEQALEALAEGGITSALVDAGGDIRVLGLRGDGQPWVTAVRNPATEDGQPFASVLAVTDVAVVTSGSYARYVEIAGRRYTHIIDPRTGWPETSVASATVIGPDATSADALATALAVLGTEEGLALIESLPGYECLIISAEGAEHRLTRSSGFARYELASASVTSPPDLAE